MKWKDIIILFAQMWNQYICSISLARVNTGRIKKWTWRFACVHDLWQKHHLNPYDQQVWCVLSIIFLPEALYYSLIMRHYGLFVYLKIHHIWKTFFFLKDVSQRCDITVLMSRLIYHFLEMLRILLRIEFIEAANSTGKCGSTSEKLYESMLDSESKFKRASW